MAIEWPEGAIISPPPTDAQITAGARSLGNTIGWDNQAARAKACWAAMQAALHGIEEPLPQNRRSRAQPDSKSVFRWVEEVRQ